MVGFVLHPPYTRMPKLQASIAVRAPLLQKQIRYSGVTKTVRRFLPTFFGFQELPAGPPREIQLLAPPSAEMLEISPGRGKRQPK